MELMKLRKSEMAPPGSPSQEPEPTIMTDLFGDHLQGYAYGGKVGFFYRVFVGPSSILWGHWYPLFRTSDDPSHEFQSQDGFIVTCAVLLFACNDPRVIYGYSE